MKNAPEFFGYIGGVPFVASTVPPEDADGTQIWIKLPEREPMIFKSGRWVPWLNAPVGWADQLSITGGPGTV